MARIRKLGVLSFARFHAVIGALLGLLFGIVYSVGGLLIDTLVSLAWIASQETPGLGYGTLLAFGALIGMPIIGAAIGCITGLIGALLYNVVARYFGGIKLDIK